MALANPTSWSDRLELILQRACECLEENTPLGAPTVIENGIEVFNCYKIHSDEWPGDCCNALIMKVTKVFPMDAASGLPNANVGSARNVRCGTTSIGVEFELRLFRPCSVMAKGNNLHVQLPTAEELNNEAESSLIDINALMCCLACDPGIVDSDSPSAESLAVRFNLGSATPFKSGDCRGWEIRGQVSMPGCVFTAV